MGMGENLGKGLRKRSSEEDGTSAKGLKEMRQRIMRICGGRIPEREEQTQNEEGPLGGTSLAYWD